MNVLSIVSSYMKTNIFTVTHQASVFSLWYILFSKLTYQCRPVGDVFHSISVPHGLFGPSW